MNNTAGAPKGLVSTGMNGIVDDFSDLPHNVHFRLRRAP